jgi:hypothetical protein
MDEHYFIHKETISKDSPFTYHPYKIIKYIEGEGSDYIEYEVESCNVFGSFQDLNNFTKYLGDDLRNFKKNYTKKISELQAEINISRETIKNMLDISTDIHPQSNHGGNSWAVISIGGSCQYVKFVDLSRRDMMDVASFLKRYEAGRHIVDSPYRQIFEKELFYFKKDNE